MINLIQVVISGSQWHRLFGRQHIAWEGSQVHPGHFNTELDKSLCVLWRGSATQDLATHTALQFLQTDVKLQSHETAVESDCNAPGLLTPFERRL